MITQNKGEWSELYVLLKLLGDGVMYATDANLNKIDDLYYPIIKIIRSENKIEREYCYNASLVRIIDSKSRNCLLELPTETFKQKPCLMPSKNPKEHLQSKKFKNLCKLFIAQKSKQIQHIKVIFRSSHTTSRLIEMLNLVLA